MEFDYLLEAVEAGLITKPLLYYMQLEVFNCNFNYFTFFQEPFCGTKFFPSSFPHES